MKWTFTVNKDPHEAEWRKGAMRCTMPEVIGTVDEIIFDGRRVPCGSASNLVKPTLENEAGGYAVITLAIKQFADYGSLQTPLSYATVITDVFDGDEELEKAKSFGGDRSAAAQYAARVRWGNRPNSDQFDPLAVPVLSNEETMKTVAAIYPRKITDYFYDEDFSRIAHYQAHGSEANTKLREGLAPEEMHGVRKLDQLFLRTDTPLDKDIVLHRGLNLDGLTVETEETLRFFDSLRVGQSFRDPAFTSTSAKDFIGTHFGGESQIRFEVVVRKGTPILPVFHIMKNQPRAKYLEEAEVLLPRGGTFKVVSVTNDYTGKVIRVAADFPPIGQQE